MATKKGSQGKAAKGQAGEARPPKAKTATTKKDDAKTDGAKKELSSALKRYNLLRKIEAQAPAYAALESRQRVVELAKRGVFVCLMDTLVGNIELAQAGNPSAAKFLLEFAGIYDLPPLSEAAVEQAAVAPNVGKPGKTSEELVLSFYKRLGMKVPVLAPEEGEQSSG